MSRVISPHLMRRKAGKGPKNRTCGDRIFCEQDDEESEGYCLHEERPFSPFFVEPEFRACGHFKSQWQLERELLEASGQKRFPVMSLGRKERNFYDLPPGAQLTDQDWTTPGFWPRRVQ
jgi:hypothetical protein